MKYHIPHITAALLALLLIGCSKHSPPAAPANPKVADLGVVEVSDGSTNRIDMGGGRVCVITSLMLKDSMLNDATIDGKKANTSQKDALLKGQKAILMIGVEEKDSNGVTRVVFSDTSSASSGQTIGLSDGVTSIRLTPHFKQ
jgi:hypothetical protein